MPPVCRRKAEAEVILAFHTNRQVRSILRCFDYGCEDSSRLDLGQQLLGGSSASVSATASSSERFAIAASSVATYPSVKAVFVFSKFDRERLEFVAEAVRDRKLVIQLASNCHSMKRLRLKQP